MTESFRCFVVRLMSIALISMGFAQASYAGIIGTEVMLETEARQDTLTRLETILAQEEVAKRLQSYGVDAADIELRLAGMTTPELIAFEKKIDTHVAGSGVIGVIGTVFVVLIILELMGITDVFKSI